MGEKDNPFVADELMEIDVSIRRFGLEVGRYATEAQAANCEPPPMELPCPNQARGEMHTVVVVPHDPFC